MKPAQLSGYAKMIGDVPTNLEHAQSLVREGQKFFEPSNLKLLEHLGVDPRSLSIMIKDLEIT